MKPPAISVWGLLFLAWLHPCVACGDEPRGDLVGKAVVELQLPPKSKFRILAVTVNGVPKGNSPTIVLDKLKEGAPTPHQLQIQLSDGELTQEVPRTVLLGPGDRVRVPITPASKPLPELVPNFGHTGAVNAVALSPIRAWALTGGDDGVAILWDIGTRRIIRKLRAPVDRDRVQAVAFSPDGRRALTGHGDGAARLWDLHTGELRKTFAGHRSAVIAVGFSHDGKQVVTACSDCAYRWETEGDGKLGPFEKRGMELRAAALSPDKQHLVTAGRLNRNGPGLAVLWDLADAKDKPAKAVRAFEGHSKTITSLAFNGTGRELVTGSEDGTALLWDASPGGRKAPIRKVAGHHEPIRSLAVTSDWKQLVVGIKPARPEEARAALWDMDSGTWTDDLIGHSGLVKAIAFSHDNRQIVTGSADNAVIVWNAQTRKLEYRLHGEPAGCKALALCRPRGQPGTTWLLVGTSTGQALLFDLQRGQPIRTFAATGGSIDAVAMSSDGEWVATAANGMKTEVVLWNGHTGQRVHTLNGHSKMVRALAISGDGKRLVTGSADKTAILWDTQTGRNLRQLTGHGDEVRSVSVNAAGTRVLTGAYERAVRLWDTDKDDPIRILEHESNEVTTVALSSDGETALTSCSRNGSVILWKTADGTKLRNLKGHSGNVMAAAFAPGGRLIATGEENSISLWDAATGNRLHTLKGHESKVFAVAFSPDGRQLWSGVAGDRDPGVRYWDIAAGDELARLVILDQGKNWLVLTPTGIYDATPQAQEKVAYRRNRQEDLPVVRTYDGFREVGLLKSIWSGERPLADVSRLGTPRPIVRFVSPTRDTVSKTHAFEVVFEAAEGEKGAGVSNLTLKINGSLQLHQPHPIGGRMAKVTLHKGTNILRITAENDDEIESDPVELHVTYDGPTAPKPALYVLAVGVSRYKDQNDNVPFADNDAQAIAELFHSHGYADRKGLYEHAHQKELSVDGATVKLLLLNEDATKDNIMKALDAIGKHAQQQNQQQKTKPTVLVFLAGHGVMIGKEYYYLTRDCTRSEVDVKAHGLRATELGDRLAAIDAQNRILVLDTCYAAGAGDITLGLDRAGSHVDRYGVFFLAASTDVAKGGGEIGHGVLTYVLLAGFGKAKRGPLKGKLIQPIDTENRVVSVSDWFNYAGLHVPKVTEDYWGGAQQAHQFQRGWARLMHLHPPGERERPGDK